MKELGSSLTDSIRAKSSIDLLSTIGDAGLDAAISSGVFDGVPIFGVVTRAWRAGKEIHQELFVRKIIRFLKELECVEPSDRQKFLDVLEQQGKKEDFGDNRIFFIIRSNK